jgi:hypothetical protein
MAMRHCRIGCSDARANFRRIGTEPVALNPDSR